LGVELGSIGAISDRWSAADAAGLGDLDTLVYLSRLLGADPDLVLWGGGNTSLKTTEPDFRGRATHVLRV
jgi:rhamnose utilization protein RhaD (predicted bifunctional aldolase and dehydrogenase)